VNETVAFEKVRRILATILDVPSEELTLQSSPASIESWDSLRHLVLAIELEQEFGVSLSPEDMERITSAGAILRLLSEREVLAAP
jgi:acyl carrier protein